MSKINHELRIRRCKFQKPDDDEAAIEHYDDDDDPKHDEIEPPPLNLCRQTFNLTGPHSPLETNTYPLMRYVEYQTATIEPLSVNSVLLDTEPQDSCTQLLVAANIGRNRSTNSIVARNTTLMPNIKGFNVLCGLIFCPTMEVNRDSTKSRYSSFLTGMGCDPKTKKPYFEEHDMLLKMDAEITVDDLETVSFSFK